MVKKQLCTLPMSPYACAVPNTSAIMTACTNFMMLSGLTLGLCTFMPNEPTAPAPLVGCSSG